MDKLNEKEIESLRKKDVANREIEENLREKEMTRILEEARRKRDLENKNDEPQPEI